MTLGRRYLKTLWLPNLHSVLILLMYSWPAAGGSLWVLRLRVIEYPNSLTNTEWEVNDDTHYITARTAFSKFRSTIATSNGVCRCAS
jgi:hypothetical protein